MDPYKRTYQKQKPRRSSTNPNLLTTPTGRTRSGARWSRTPLNSTEITEDNMGDERDNVPGARGGLFTPFTPGILPVTPDTPIGRGAGTTLGAVPRRYSEDQLGDESFRQRAMEKLQAKVMDFVSKFSSDTQSEAEMVKTFNTINKSKYTAKR